VSVLISIFAVLLGLAFGSFLNVCISRLPRHESVVTPRSRCPRCLMPILNRDNIPLLSWVLLRGRCRSCGVWIPVRYPLVECVTAALFLLCSLKFGLTPHCFALAVFCWLLLGLAVTDAETLMLPDALTFAGIVLGIFVSSFQGVSGVAPMFSIRAAGASLLWATCAAAFIILIRGLYWLVRRREGIGLGDAKLLAMVAAWLGPWQAGLVLFLATICAAAYGLGRIAWFGGRQSSGNKVTLRIPLGAFLCAAGILSIFEGDTILAWYLGFFH
jgi:leader peptidase (prepilin peptidase) / N-methyltransferase